MNPETYNLAFGHYPHFPFGRSEGLDFLECLNQPLDSYTIIAPMPLAFNISKYKTVKMRNSPQRTNNGGNVADK